MLSKASSWCFALLDQLLIEMNVCAALVYLYTIALHCFYRIDR